MSTVSRQAYQRLGTVAGVAGWTFLTNHAAVLACIAREPGVRLRDIAACAGITERATHRIVCELEADGYLTRHRVGARNLYEVHPERPLRHREDPDLDVGALLRLLSGRAASPDAAREDDVSAAFVSGNEAR